MKLLILTQRVDVDNDILGFFHDWIHGFARRFDKVIVICLYEGRHDLPNNVKVLSLGKENGVSRLKYLYRFYKYIWGERNNYDVVFVHMNQIYVILGGLLWRLWHKKIGLWYAHGYVSITLRMAERLTDIIFTSTASGCRLISKKIKIVGQGIDINKFSVSGKKSENTNSLNVLTIGRISPVKDYETLINAVEILVKEGLDLKVNIVGGAGMAEQEAYLKSIKALVREKELGSNINFVGQIPNKDIIAYLRTADLFVNMSHTGSLDKAILEAMSCSLPILTCNEALGDVLGDYSGDLMYEKRDYKKLAERIRFISNLTEEEKNKMGDYLRSLVVKDHSLDNLIKKIINIY